MENEEIKKEWKQIKDDFEYYSNKLDNKEHVDPEEFDKIQFRIDKIKRELGIT